MDRLRRHRGFAAVPLLTLLFQLLAIAAHHHDHASAAASASGQCLVDTARCDDDRAPPPNRDEPEDGCSLCKALANLAASIAPDQIEVSTPTRIFARIATVPTPARHWSAEPRQAHARDPPA